jgi:hypothetical protein
MPNQQFCTRGSHVCHEVKLSHTPGRVGGGGGGREREREGGERGEGGREGGREGYRKKRADQREERREFISLSPRREDDTRERDRDRERSDIEYLGDYVYSCKCQVFNYVTMNTSRNSSQVSGTLMSFARNMSFR